MESVAKIGRMLEEVFGRIVEDAAKESGVIVRKRKFHAVSLAKTFILGFLQKPTASDEQLAQMAAQCGVDVTAQAVEQRYTPQMVKFMERIFRGAVKLVMSSNKAMAPILERFGNVTLCDSSVLTLPEMAKDEFPGCGGSHGSGTAAMKLQTEFDFRGGGVFIEIESGRSTDGATKRQWVRRGEGSLRITDLGYFNIAVFEEQQAAAEHFLSRLQFGTNVLLRNGQAVDLLSWLANQKGKFVDQPILLGSGKRLPCRLIAWRLPPAQANRARQKLRQEMLSKSGKEPSAERLAWCDWTILVTSVPAEMLTPEEAVVLYRARWQIELLFKRWKSQGLVAELSGSTETRQLVRVWSRLMSALLQHWLTVATVWGDPTKSLSKVFEAVRSFAGRIAAGLTRPNELRGALQDLCRAVQKTCRRNKREKAGTNELLNDIELLDFSLT